MKSADSFIHTLHPFTKIGLTGVLTVAAMMMDAPVSLAILIAFVGLMLVMARIRPSLSHVIIGFVLAGVLVLLHRLLDATFEETLRSVLRLGVVVFAAPLAAMTTDPLDLTRALSRLRAPSGVLIGVLLIWRFVPALIRQAKDVSEADRLRGARLRHRLRSFLRVSFWPMLLFAFDHAERTALALELRGFDPSRERTWFDAPVFQWPDAAITLSLLVIVGAALALEMGWVS